MTNNKIKSKLNYVSAAGLSAAVLASTLFSMPLKADVAGGAAIYKTKCAACHGPDGKGETAIGKADKIRDLSSAEVQQQSDVELNTFITAGKGKMPAYGKSVKPDQVKDLVDFIRSLAKK
jgi:cytochrome c6